MALRDLAPDSWPEELDSFSRQHEGWIVSITTRSADKHVAVAARDVPLLGVTPGSPQSSDIAISVGDSRQHLTHEVRNVEAVEIDLTVEHAERGLIIHGRDGSTTRVEFRSPMRPEDVDGLPTPEHS
jgi:Family of unknown function (DUF5335)